MTVDEAEGGVVESELNHDTALPAIAEQILHDEVLASISHEDTVESLHEYGHENLTFAHETHLDIVLLPKVVSDQGGLFFFLSTALLCTEGDDIVVHIVWKECFKVDILGLSGMVPRHAHDLKRDLTLDQIPRNRRQVLIV